MYVGAPQGIEIAPASEFHDFRSLNPPPASLFLKISWFPKFGLMTTDAWTRITFLFRNGQPSYFQKMIFKHRRTGWFWQNLQLHRFRYRKSRSKFQNVWTPWLQFVEQSPLQTILLYGCNHSTSHVESSVGAPQGIEIAPASEFHDFRGLSPPPASLFSENFSIFENRPHDDRCVFP